MGAWATRQRILALLAGVALVSGVLVLRPLGRGGAEVSRARLATVSVGDVVLSAGGLGRVVQTGASALAAPTPSTPTAASAGSGTTLSNGRGVFPAASGRVVSVLVAAGDQVVVDQPLATLDDGGNATAALELAGNELASARFELQQKQISDPTRGGPPTQAERDAAQLGVDQAKQRLGQLSGPPPRVDVIGAQLELAKAQADLGALTRPPAPAAIRAARLSAEAATRKVAQVSGPASPVDIAVARFEEAKARADLDALQQSGSAGPSALRAAELSVEAAIQRMAQVTGPRNSTDIAAAQAEAARADADLDALERSPDPGMLAMNQLAVTLAEQRLDLVLHPTSSALDAARLEAAKAQVDVELLRLRSGPASRTDLLLAQLKVALASSHVDDAEAQAGRLTVRTRAAGVVTAMLTTIGANAEMTAPIATVANIDDVDVSVDLSEFDAAAVKQGQSATVSVDALGGKPLAGTVLVGPLAGVDNGGVVSFPVRIGLNERADVKPGMSVSVKIRTDERRGVVRVPLEAVARSAGKRTVTVVDPSGAATRRPVTLGLADNTFVEVTGGLRSGERIRLPVGSGA